MFTPLRGIFEILLPCEYVNLVFLTFYDSESDPIRTVITRPKIIAWQLRTHGSPLSKYLCRTPYNKPGSRLNEAELWIGQLADIKTATWLPTGYQLATAPTLSNKKKSKRTEEYPGTICLVVKIRLAGYLGTECRSWRALRRLGRSARFPTCFSRTLIIPIPTFSVTIPSTL